MLCIKDIIVYLKNLLISISFKNIYFKSRDIEGIVKTITIKRDTLGDIYLYFVCETNENKVLARTGKSVGYDFGLKQFLTASDNEDIKAPLFFKQNANDMMNCQSKCDTSFKNKLNGLSQFKHFLGLLFNNINFSIKSSLDIFPKSVFFG